MTAQQNIHSRLRKRFGPYRAEVAGLAIALKEEENPWVIPGYLNEGSDVDAVLLTSDPAVVAKIPHGILSDVSAAKHIVERVETLIRGYGIPNTEQIVAYSKNKKYGAVLCGFVDGPTLRHCDADERDELLDTDFEGLVTTWKGLHNKHLRPEGGSSNVVRASHGLVVIDYEYDPRATLLGAAVEFGSRGMLLEEAYTHDPVPGYALRFRNVCAELLGNEVAVAVENDWRRNDFTRFTPYQHGRTIIG